MKRYMELLWARNRSATGDKKSDRQYAYDFGSKFLQQTSHIRESGRMTDEETEAWDAVQKLVQQYAANPGITTGSTDS